MYPPNSPWAPMHSCKGAPHEYDAFCCNGLLFVAVLLVQHNRLIQIYLRWTVSRVLLFSWASLSMRKGFVAAAIAGMPRGP